MERVVLTGAAGRLGASLTAELRSQGRTVIGLDLIGVDSDPDHVVVEVSDVDRVAGLLRPDDLVVHLASVHPYSGGVSTPPAIPDETYLALNAAGTWHLYAAAARAGVRRVILTSSLAASARTAGSVAPVDDSLTSQPQGIYAITKWFQEGVARSFAATHGISTAVLRPPAFVDIHPLRTGYSLAMGTLLLEDVLTAHVAAVDAAPSILSLPGVVPVYSIANVLPYTKSDEPLISEPDRLPLLDRYWPGAERWFRERGFDPVSELNFAPLVVDIAPAARDLGWGPQITFGRWFESVRDSERE